MQHKETAPIGKTGAGVSMTSWDAVRDTTGDSDSQAANNDFGHQPPSGWWTASIIGAEVFDGNSEATRTLAMTLCFTESKQTGRFLLPLNYDSPYVRYLRRIGVDFFASCDPSLTNGREVAVLFARAPNFNGQKRARIQVIHPFDPKIGGVA